MGLVIISLDHPEKMDLFEFRQEEFCLAVIVVKVVRYRVGGFKEFKYGKMKRPASLGERDFQVVVHPEISVQLAVNMPAQLVISRRRCNPDQVGIFKEILH